MDAIRTMTGEHRRCPEYSESFPTRPVDETGQFSDRTRMGSTQVRWFGQDLSRAPDSGIGYTQDHRTRWADNGWVEPDSYRLTASQLMGRKHRAGGRLATRRNVDSTVHRMESQWGIPHKRALIGSDGPDSMSSSSDVVEGHHLEPPDDRYPVMTQSGLIQNNDSCEEAWSPSRRLEVVVARLQKDIADYRKEIKVSSVQSTAIPSRPTKRSDLRQRQFLDFRDNLAGNNIGRCLRQLCVKMAGMTS